ncbi:hypothetical protein IFM89_033447 [Coptis chinensis]|uniref:RNase H type-1 domain-containing protein n=1 Tax=Coptis chinensis TaxID=261450 RepID=A0A835LTR3_9MAGN|nr:hypothetical protein IFM89_033447 [Coptis chinensis]
MPFRDMVDGCELIDLGFMGNTFTWTNKQKGRRRIWERIDRSLANDAWMLRFVNIKVYHEMATSSDHKFLIIKVDNVHDRLSTPFRFEAMWLQDSGCSEQVRLVFDVDTVGSPSFTLYNKLKHCQQNLPWWNKHIFGQLENRFKDIQQELQSVQDSIIANADPTDELITEEQRLMQEHNVLLVQQATHWGQKSCSDWTNYEGTTQVCLLGMGLWHIWLARNDSRFNHSTPNPILYVRKVHGMMQILHNILVEGLQKQTIALYVKWHPPSDDWEKLNTDGAAIGNPRFGGAGLRIRKVILETDSQLLFKSLTDGELELHWLLRKITTEIISLLTTFEEYKIVLCYREGNSCADSFTSYTANLAAKDS